MSSSHKRKPYIIVPLGLVGLCLLAFIASALSNIGLPEHSRITDRLDDLEKARLSEVIHLRTALGDAVWPGWSQASIPLVAYNEKYAFLVGYPEPPAGWLKVPRMEARGGPWERVPGDLFEVQPYYRTLIVDPEKSPEAFTVLVGSRWVATFQTREYSEIAFYRGIREGLPPVVSQVVPVRLAWTFLMGKTDNYIAALEHESFHAYEGMLAPDSLAKAEQLPQLEQGYPFDAMQGAWAHEMDVLVQAAETPDDSACRTLVRKFLQLRDERRRSLTPQQIELERMREWEGGLAKYAELEISRQASIRQSYMPTSDVLRDPDFKSYAGQQEFWLQQLREARNSQGRAGDTRFYYAGNAMAVVLERLMPGWKAQSLPGGRYLEDLLQQAVR